MQRLWILSRIVLTHLLQIDTSEGREYICRARHTQIRYSSGFEYFCFLGPHLGLIKNSCGDPSPPPPLFFSDQKAAIDPRLKMAMSRTQMIIYIVFKHTNPSAGPWANDGGRSWGRTKNVLQRNGKNGLKTAQCLDWKSSQSVHFTSQKKKFFTF